MAFLFLAFLLVAFFLVAFFLVAFFLVAFFFVAFFLAAFLALGTARHLPPKQAEMRNVLTCGATGGSGGRYTPERSSRK